MLRNIGVALLVALAIIGMAALSGIAVFWLAPGVWSGPWILTNTILNEHPRLLLLVAATSLGIAALIGALSESWEFPPKPAQLATMLVTACAGVSVVFHEISVLQAGLVVSLSAIGILAAWRALELLSDGDTIELRSHWGGIGGGLGGWQISPLGVLIILVIITVFSAVEVVRPVTAGDKSVKGTDLHPKAAPTEAVRPKEASGEPNR
jgi:hypothetical protein